MHSSLRIWGVLIIAMLFYSVWVISLGGQAHGFLSPRTSYVSELAATGEPLRDLFRYTDGAAGVLIAVFALFSFSRVRGALARASLIALLVGSVGIVGDAIFTFECPITASAQCLKDSIAGALPFHHHAHAVTSSIAGAGLITALLLQMVLLFKGRRRRAWPFFVLVLIAGVTLLASIFAGPDTPEPYRLVWGELGIWQRVNLLVTSVALPVAFFPVPRTRRT